ncbi:MAG: hypothetical protein ACREP9_16040 [Candidatus Dormibacteraceae bacterium]
MGGRTGLGCVGFWQYDRSGTIILGVTSDYEHLGLEVGTEVDTIKVCQAIEKYIDGNFSLVAAAHRLQLPAASEEKTFGLIFFTKGGAHPLLPACDAPQLPSGSPLFKAGDIFIRRGARDLPPITGPPAMCVRLG